VEKKGIGLETLNVPKTRELEPVKVQTPGRKAEKHTWQLQEMTSIMARFKTSMQKTMTQREEANQVAIDLLYLKMRTVTEKLS